VKPAFFGLFALCVLIALACARGAYAQDDASSGDAITSSDSATSADSTTSGDAATSSDAAVTTADSSANWKRVDPDSPAADLSADSADKVLEIPQTACFENGVTIPCDERLSVNKSSANGDDNGDGGDTITSPGGGMAPASPQTFDANENTASAGPAIGSDSDWGTAEDYQNQQAYGFPYAISPYGLASRGPVYGSGYGSGQVPPSGFLYPPMATSSPITQAARPPLSPWMTPPSMLTYSRPAGSPMFIGRPAGSPMMMMHPMMPAHAFRTR
jgi:hypothetical protein